MIYGEFTWGEFSYGVSERPLRERGAQRVPLDREITPSELEALGSGWGLTNRTDVLENDRYLWDFKVDNTGDLMGFAGRDELGKDIAWRTATRSDNIIGFLNTADARADLEVDIKRIVRDDQRVYYINNVSVLDDATDPDTIPVEIDIDSESDRFHRDVIPVFTS